MPAEYQTVSWVRPTRSVGLDLHPYDAGKVDSDCVGQSRRVLEPKGAVWTLPVWVGQTVFAVCLFKTMIDSRRRLPHWVPDDVPVFVTWRLAGTLPRSVREFQQSSAGERFAATDSELDRTTSGPLWLRDRRVASMVIEALHYGATVKRWYELHAHVVMPNHVHVIWTPKVALPRILQWLKGVTAKRAKRLLCLNVKAFWQDESYDHWIRSGRELQKIIRYVEWNPVKAGLADSVEQWRWSSVHITGASQSQTTRSSAPPLLESTPENV